MVLTRRTVAINKNIGGFLRAMPSNYTTTKKYPLLISLHGKADLGTGSYSDLAKVETKGVPYYLKMKKFPATLTVNNQLFSYIVISPQFKAWPANTDVNSVVDFCKRYYSIDTSRIYLTGLSMGGGAVWEYARGYGQRIAAIAPMAGTSTPTYAKAQSIANKKVVVWGFHNSSDPYVPVSNTIKYVDYINRYYPPVAAKKTIFTSNLHDCWTKVCDPAYQPGGLNIYEWFLKYRRR
jgi:predicted peptidase